MFDVPCEAAFESEGRLLTVLIVDDDQDCRAIVRDAIQQVASACRIIECTNGRDALEFLFEAAPDDLPDVVFLDVEMPLMSGLELLEMIKAHPQIRQIPVVMVSGLVDTEAVERAAQLGANSYTAKPGRIEDFIRTVQLTASYWLNVHQFPRCHARQEATRR